LIRNRRLAKNDERKVQTSETLIEVATSRLVLRWLARQRDDGGMIVLDVGPLGVSEVIGIRRAPPNERTPFRRDAPFARDILAPPQGFPRHAARDAGGCWRDVEKGL
jgi:hypothetical protein